MDDLRWVTRTQAQELEPHVECAEVCIPVVHAMTGMTDKAMMQALYSPSTGIVDSHSLMLALQGDAEAHGANVVRSTTVEGIQNDEPTRQLRVITRSLGSGANAEPFSVECDYFINATGLLAPMLLQASIGIKSLPHIPTISPRFAKGTYFRLRDNSKPFRSAPLVF